MGHPWWRPLHGRGCRYAAEAAAIYDQSHRQTNRQTNRWTASPLCGGSLTREEISNDVKQMHELSRPDAVSYQTTKPLRLQPCDPVSNTSCSRLFMLYLIQPPASVLPVCFHSNLMQLLISPTCGLMNFLKLKQLLNRPQTVAARQKTSSVRYSKSRPAHFIDMASPVRRGFFSPVIWILTRFSPKFKTPYDHTKTAQ